MAEDGDFLSLIFAGVSRQYQQTKKSGWLKERRNSRGAKQEEIAQGRARMTAVCSVDIRRPANFAGLMPGEKKYIRLIMR